MVGVGGGGGRKCQGPLGSHGTNLVVLCENKRSSSQLGMLNILEYLTIHLFLHCLNAVGGAIVLSKSYLKVKCKRINPY